MSALSAPLLAMYASDEPVPISDAIDDTLTIAAPGWSASMGSKRAPHLERTDHVDAVDAMEIVGVEAVEVLRRDELRRPGVVDEHVDAAEALFDQLARRRQSASSATSARTTSASAPSARHSAATASASAASREKLTTTFQPR